MFLYLVQVQAVLYTINSATSYYQFCGTTPFKIACGSYGQPNANIQAELIWQHTKMRAGYSMNTP